MCLTSPCLPGLNDRRGTPQKNLFADEEGKKPWKEIVSIVQAVCNQLGIEVPALFKVTSRYRPRLRSTVAQKR